MVLSTEVWELNSWPVWHEAERTVLMNSLFQAIQEFKKGKVEYRVDKTGIVHLAFGQVNFTDEDLIINLMAAVVCIFFI